MNLRKGSGKLYLDFNELKSGGFIKQIQKNLFTVRLRWPGRGKGHERQDAEGRRAGGKVREG